jgi:hypothetical protein
MNLRSYKTTKGTELPLLNLRGKEYLEVKYRLVWFREDHSDWSIETDLVSVTDVSAYAKATIRNDTGRIIATSHKFESIQGFPDFIEKAETGSIGRALALIGYGTQFCADELDEGKDKPATAPQGKILRGGNFERVKVQKSILDAPPATEPESETEDATAPLEPGEFLISFGRKFNGRKLKDVRKSELKSYLEWLEGNAGKQGSPVSKQARILRQAFERFYDGVEAEDQAEMAMPF